MGQKRKEDSRNKTAKTKQKPNQGIQMKLQVQLVKTMLVYKTFEIDTTKSDIRFQCNLDHDDDIEDSLHDYVEDHRMIELTDEADSDWESYFPDNGSAGGFTLEHDETNLQWDVEKVSEVK